MLSKLKNPRIKLFVIALSLAITATILGLSAYIAEKEEYSASFHTATGSELGFSIVGDPYDNTIVYPGDTIPINLEAKVEGNIPLYLFIEFNIPSDCTVDGLNSEAWHPIADKSNVYYFGNNGILYPLGGENGSSSKVFDNLKLSSTAAGGQSYELIITGYAIQKKLMETYANSPSTVYEELIKSLPSGSVQPTTTPGTQEGGNENEGG